MRRQCAWFGCNAVATATYTFDSSTCTVWLDTPLDGGARAGELCRRHAGSLKPPRGWQIEDRRPSAASPSSDSSTSEFGAPIAEPVTHHDARDDFDSEAELRTLLDVHTPLLARAFRSSGAV